MTPPDNSFRPLANLSLESLVDALSFSKVSLIGIVNLVTILFIRPSSTSTFGLSVFFFSATIYSYLPKAFPASLIPKHPSVTTTNDV